MCWMMGWGKRGRDSDGEEEKEGSVSSENKKRRSTALSANGAAQAHRPRVLAIDPSVTKCDCMRRDSERERGACVRSLRQEITM